MEFTVSLESFEGPLDLMLHLVRTSKLDLFDLHLDLLAGQYIAYIHKAMDQGLDVSSEYLVEFTTLLEYKSRKLLPRKQEVRSEDGQTYVEDPAEQIARRLQEYEKLQKLSAKIEQLGKARAMQIGREPSSRIDEWQKTTIENGELSMSADALSRAFIRVLRRHRLLSPWQTKVEVKELSVEERMEQILAFEFFNEKPFRFERLFEDVVSLHEAVVTFLALLELIHEGTASAQSIEADGVLEGEEQGKEEVWIQRIQASR